MHAQVWDEEFSLRLKTMNQVVVLEVCMPHPASPSRLPAHLPAHVHAREHVYVQVFVHVRVHIHARVHAGV